MDTTFVKERITEARHNLSQVREVLEVIDTLDFPDGISLHLNGWDNTLLFSFSDYKLLPAARKMARAAFPSWDGEIESVWAPYENHRCVSWVDKENPIIEFRLSCEDVDFPMNITGKEGCAWVKETRVTESFVCNHG